MITTNLYEEILIKPVSEGADKLLIVSGYASSAMAFHHLEEIRKAKKSIEVELIIGMTYKDGLSIVNHKGFQKIANEDYAGKFQCRYLAQNPPVHSKIYTWLKNGVPYKCFIGSANYSQFAFNVKPEEKRIVEKKAPTKVLQREVLTKCEPREGLKYFNDLAEETIPCNHIDVENSVTIYSEEQYRQRFTAKPTVFKRTNRNQPTIYLLVWMFHF